MTLRQPAPSKPTYSYSSLEKAKCGERYRLGKLEPRKESTYQMSAGSMLDCAFNAYYADNAHLHETHEERLAYARAALELHLSEHPEYYDLQWSAKAGDPRSSPENYTAWLFDCGALALVCRRDRGPVEVQKKVTVELPHYNIVGYIDCLELDTQTIVDVKSVAGWGTVTPVQYALRAQVPLYRMLHYHNTKQITSGRYELLMCRKKPSLVTVPDSNIDYLQESLIADFDKFHKMVSTNTFTKNPGCCTDFNRACQHLAKCWPSLAPLVAAPTESAP